MLFRARAKPEQLAVLKVYGTCAETQWQKCIARLIEESVAKLHPTEFDYSINYGEPRRLKRDSLTHALAGYSTLEYLDVISDEERCGAFMTAPFAGTPASGLYEYCVYRQCSDDPTDFFTDIARIAAHSLQVTYGYGRLLTNDSNPLSETRRKRLLLGGTALTNDPALHKWKDGPTRGGGIKGVYTFNVVAAERLHDRMLGELGDTLATGTAAPLGFGLAAVSLTAQELAAARQRYPEIANFIRP